MVGIAQHLVVDGVRADRRSHRDGGGIIPIVHGIDHSAFMANASRNQLLSLTVVLQVGDSRRSRKCGRFLCDLKGGRAVYDVVAAVVVADGDRGRTGVDVVTVGYAVLSVRNLVAVVRDSDGGCFRRSVIDVGVDAVGFCQSVAAQRDGGRDFPRVDGHGHRTGRYILMIAVALYHVVHNVCARRCFLGNGLLIAPILLQRIHHCTAGGAAWGHQLLLRPIVGQALALRSCVPHCAGFLDGELHPCFCECVVAAGACRDGHRGVTDILVVDDAHAVVAGCQHRVIILRRDGHIGVLRGSVVGVGVSGGRDSVIRLQVIAGQRDGHSNRSGVDRPLGSIGIADRVLAGVPGHSRGGAVQRDRLARARVGILVDARQPVDPDAVGSVHQIAGLHRRCDCGIVNGCGSIVDLRSNGHLRHNRLWLHSKGPAICCGRVVGDRPYRLDRDGPGTCDGENACGRVNSGAGPARLNAPGDLPVSGAAGGLQRCDCVAVIDLLGLAGDFQRALGRRLDFNLSGRGKRIIPVDHIHNGGRISASRCQQSIRNRRIVVRPCDRVLFGINHGIAVLDSDFRVLLRVVVQEGGFRQLHRGRDGLGVNGHGNRGRIHGYAGIVGGLVYLIIDGVSTRVGPGGNLRGELGSIQGIHQEAYVGLPRRDQRLRLSAVRQRVDFLRMVSDRRSRLGDVRSHRIGIADVVFGRVRAGHLDLGGIQRGRLPRTNARGVKGGGDAGRGDGHRVTVDCSDAGRGHGGVRRTVIGLIIDHDRSRNGLGLGSKGPLIGDRQVVLTAGFGGRDGDLANACDLHLAGGRVHGGRTRHTPGHGAAAGAAAG